MKSFFHIPKGIFGARPGRRSTNDWIVFLVVMTAISATSAVYHLFLFLNVEKNTSPGEVEQVPVLKTLNRDDLHQAVEAIQKRSGANPVSLPEQEE